MPTKDLAIIGGGAAGFFCAATLLELCPSTTIELFEASNKPLAKVLVSGGGRCNVTHNCFDPKTLVRSYPRGGRELLGPFTRFQPRDMVAWLESHGVRTKAEPDGRIFPQSDRSETIADLLRKATTSDTCQVLTTTKVRKITPQGSEFIIELNGGERREFKNILIATGSSQTGHELATELGHSIAECAPSLFTFKVTNPLIQDLQGTSVSEVHLTLRVDNKRFEQAGPLLITHWGLSGPAVLKLSAWAARELKRAEYKAILSVNWTGHLTQEQCLEELTQWRARAAQRSPFTTPLFGITKRFWERVLDGLKSTDAKQIRELSNAQLRSLAATLTNTSLEVSGKGEFKEEFVTCGGVTLKEIDFKFAQSKIRSGLFFAGEVLDIDGITGGFNFQAAWTMGWIAAHGIAQRLGDNL